MSVLNGKSIRRLACNHPGIPSEYGVDTNPSVRKKLNSVAGKHAAK